MIFNETFDSLLLLFVGLAGLWGGTQLTVQNSVRLAQRFSVSELFVGLTLLALGTDLPELVVAVEGSLLTRGGIPSSGVVVGTAVGSSVGQGSLVLGLTAMLHYLSVGRRQLPLLAVQLLVSIAAFAAVAWDGVISRNDGIILVMVFALYLTQTVAQRGVGVEEETEGPDRPWWVELLLVLAGLVIVILASELTVEKALVLSELAGLKQSFVGAVIVALGTSTPELAISLRAISQGKAGLSVGNIVGSNIFDMLIPPGVAALITPLLVEASVLKIDLPFLVLVTVLAIAFLARKRGLQRWEGMTLVGVYVVYALTRLALSAINGS